MCECGGVALLWQTGLCALPLDVGVSDRVSLMKVLIFAKDENVQFY